MVSLWPALEKVPRRRTGTRASNPKTRTGCGTCKIRRVKCDEFKPKCKRCEKYGTICDGYGLPAGKQGPPSASHRIIATAKILPKGQLQISGSFEVPNIYRFDSGPRFENAAESRCFRVYCDEMARCITGPFTSSLWAVMIPQASEMEPFVRHAAVAIGALAEVSKDKKGSLPRASPSNSPNSTYALKKYHQSLRRMREAVASGDHDVRKLLLASLLVFCLESLQGNLVSAVSHAERGIMLFYQSLYKTGPPTTPCASTRCLDKHILGGDLMHAYAGLDLYILFFLDTRSEEIHREILVHQNTHIRGMPMVIENTGDARKFALLIMRRNYRFFKIASKNADMNAPRAFLDRDESPWEGSCRVMSSLMCSPGRPSRALQDEYKRYTGDMMQWAKACSVLFRRIRESGTHAERILVNTLEMNSKASNIVLTGQFFSSELDYDPFLGDFKEIISLAESIQPDLFKIAEGSARFHFGYGVNWPLFLVGVRCRDTTVRNQAIRLLGRQEHREGVWDAIALARIAEWVRDMEEKNMGPDQFVEEEQRVFLTSCNMDLQARKVFVRVMRRAQEGLVARKTLLTW